ncbi:MAG: flagellar biosynthesis protein FlhF [Planctomycetes bacterium]|nr:flagellar biosynthesis protein FlhF [Planctomycetota bacterium]
MKLKTFRAPSMRDALVMVKREFGSQAVIVGTRSVKTGGFLGFGGRTVVEVTASPQPQKSPRQQRRDEPQPKTDMDTRVRETYGQLVAQAREEAVRVSAVDLRNEMTGLKDMVQRLIQETRSTREPDVPTELFDLYVGLLSNEVADEMAKELVKTIREELPENQWQNEYRVRETLIRYIASRIDVAGPTVLEGPSPRVIALIGPTGVGKTTTLAKLAAQFKLRQGHSVGLITIDTYRIGAVDQLRTYAEIIDVPLKVVLTPKELQRAVAEFKDKDFVLIDTAGRSQRDVLKMNELRQFLDAVRPDETHLVMSSTCGQKNVESVLERFSQFKIDRVLLTKMDEAVSFGIILTVLQRTKQKLSYVTVGQDVPDDIEAGQPRKLAELIVPPLARNAERAVQ